MGLAWQPGSGRSEPHHIAVQGVPARRALAVVALGNQRIALRRWRQRVGREPVHRLEIVVTSFTVGRIAEVPGE